MLNYHLKKYFTVVLNKLATLPHKKNINFDIDFRLRLYIFFCIFVQTEQKAMNESSRVFLRFYGMVNYTPKKKAARETRAKRKLFLIILVFCFERRVACTYIYMCLLLLLLLNSRSARISRGNKIKIKKQHKNIMRRRERKCH